MNILKSASCCDRIHLTCPFKVASIIEGKFQPSALAQLVSSQLDVDRMDYLLRDSLMTGAKYGIYDLEWIINALAIDEAADRIYVQARGSMQSKNICKRATTCFARSTFIARCDRRKQCCDRSCDARWRCSSEGKEVWHAPGTAFEKILRRETLTISEHMQVDDSDFVFHIKQWQNSATRF
jgi:hypothetical protein